MFNASYLSIVFNSFCVFHHQKHTSFYHLSSINFFSIMDTFTVPSFESKWDHSVSHRAAFHSFWRPFQEDALRLYPENSLDNRGLIFAIITDAFFLVRFGAAKAPRVHPGPPAGNRVQLTVNDIDLKAYMFQQLLITRLRTYSKKFRRFYSSSRRTSTVR